MKVKTAAERKAAERERNRAEGFKLLQKWVHERDEARVCRLIERLNQRRGKQ